MKTKLTEQELSFYNALCENKKEYKKKLSKDFFLHKLFKSIQIKDKSYEEIDFAFDLNAKKNFMDDSILLFESLNGIYIGKIKDYFWMINEYENIYFISKSMIDITNKIMKENLFLDLNDIESFYDINQNFYKTGSFKDYLEEYRVFAKQYGYSFDLMKDIQFSNLIKSIHNIVQICKSFIR